MLGRLLLALPLALLLGTGAVSAADNTADALVPRPASVTAAAGAFSVSARTRVTVPAGDQAAQQVAARFVDLVARTGGPRLQLAPSSGDAGAITFRRRAGLPEEGYRLLVSAGGATVEASADAGLFHGAVTLAQLVAAAKDGRIDAVTVADQPRFRWRGLMLDSARHFQSPAFVMRVIDAMAYYKLNTLHWHLVDDQGWRVEIKRYPKLTQVSAWRQPAVAPGAPALPRTGGFYTQAEIRKIVAYAAERHITIVPEIEMPGHALAAIRAYPELGMGVPIPPGTESDWGVFPWLYRPDETSLGFLRNVMDEVMALFPSPFIHVGGDEAVKDQWDASPAARAQVARLGLKDTEALQGWFVAQIGAYLTAHGRRLIGWDEILDGGVPADATVMSWRGIDGAVAAARAGHDTVLSPAPILYIDHRQGTGPVEPPGREAPITIGQLYAFEPVPPTLGAAERAHVLGLQANLWTEHVQTDARAAWMLFPRALAIAETGWSPAEAKSFANFLGRLPAQIRTLDRLGIGAATSAFAVAAAVDPADGGGSRVTLTNQSGLPIRYTLDGSAPGPDAALYAAAFTTALPARLRAATFAAEGAALPGELDRTLAPEDARRRTGDALDLCSDGAGLVVEDDAPAVRPRAALRVNITEPCWIYRAAPVAGAQRIAVEVGQVPFNFQIGKDLDNIHFHTPATPAGEVEVRGPGCGGERLAVLPLAPAVRNPGLTTLEAAIAVRAGTMDLCLTYTAAGVEPMWVVQSVALLTR